MQQHSKQHDIKFVGINGQISLGKENAGKMISIDHVEENVWIIKAGTFIPESQKWLYKNNGIERIEEALKWAENHEPKDNFEEMIKDILK
jgi:hypothetical protein